MTQTTPAPRHVTILLNPSAGKGQARRFVELTAQALQARGVGVTTLTGASPADSSMLAAQARDSGTDLILSGGGDGMCHLVLQELAGRELAGRVPPLVVLPAGSGNDTAMHLGMPTTPDGCAQVVLGGATIGFDLARVNFDASGQSRWVATVLAGGFDAAVNERANSMRWPPGRRRYDLAMVAELAHFRPLPYTLDLELPDGSREHQQLNAMLVAVGNGPRYGGGMQICHGAQTDDGLLDVLVLREVSKLELLRVFPKVFAGTHLTHPQISGLRQARSVRLDSPGIVAYGDGERIGPLPVTVTAVPNAVTVRVPDTIVSSQ